MLFPTARTASVPLPHHAPPYRLVSVGVTDKGMQRSRNEDFHRCFPEIGLFVLADGMGGTPAGDVAARMAVELVYEELVAAKVTSPLETGEANSWGLPLLVHAIERANHGVYCASLRTRAFRGMGTTITALLACGDRAVLAHVGDSRIYQLRGCRLVQLTEDHSLFAEMVQRGLADPDHPEAFPHRNVITRSLGGDSRVDVDARLAGVAPGDTFLLCSDGLCGVLVHDELAEILIAHVDLEQAAEQLIARANERGGPDNITAVLVRWEAAGVAPRENERGACREERDGRRDAA